MVESGWEAHQLNKQSHLIVSTEILTEGMKVQGQSIRPVRYQRMQFLNYNLIKSKVLLPEQEEYLKNLLGSFNGIEPLELIYKHFSEFNDKETKTKNFTLKFKEKLKKIKEKNNVM